MTTKRQPIKFGIGRGTGTHYMVLVKGRKVGSIRKVKCREAGLQGCGVRYRVNG